MLEFPFAVMLNISLSESSQQMVPYKAPSCLATSMTILWHVSRMQSTSIAAKILILFNSLQINVLNGLTDSSMRRATSIVSITPYARYVQDSFNRSSIGTGFSKLTPPKWTVQRSSLSAQSFQTMISSTLVQKYKDDRLINS